MSSPACRQRCRVGEHRFADRFAAPLDLSALGPVILVPGYGGSDTVLETLANRLHSAGRTTILLALPDDATGDLNAQAGVLAARVTEALKAGAPSVDLVGYSAGGIVIGLFVAAHPKEVRQIVTIGSPLHGTQIAELGVTLNAPASICPTACREMAPGSAVLTSLTAAEPAKTGVPWTSMWTNDDQVVLPPDSARFTGATNIVLQDVCADDTANHLNCRPTNSWLGSRCAHSTHPAEAARRRPTARVCVH